METRPKERWIKIVSELLTFKLLFYVALCDIFLTGQCFITNNFTITTLQCFTTKNFCDYNFTILYNKQLYNALQQTTFRLQLYNAYQQITLLLQMYFNNNSLILPIWPSTFLSATNFVIILNFSVYQRFLKSSDVNSSDSIRTGV